MTPSRQNKTHPPKICISETCLLQESSKDKQWCKRVLEKLEKLGNDLNLETNCHGI